MANLDHEKNSEYQLQMKLDTLSGLVNPSRSIATVSSVFSMLHIKTFLGLETWRIICVYSLCDGWYSVRATIYSCPNNFWQHFIIFVYCFHPPLLLIKGWFMIIFTHKLHMALNINTLFARKYYCLRYMFTLVMKRSNMLFYFYQKWCLNAILVPSPEVINIFIYFIWF